VLQVADLRGQGMSYPQIAARLSISVSTAHYRQSRYEQAADPIPFFRVWVRILCAAGLRIDEACRARRSDVDVIAMRLRVGHAKTPAGLRTVQLTPDTAADLERYLQTTSERPASSRCFRRAAAPPTTARALPRGSPNRSSRRPTRCSPNAISPRWATA